MRSKQTNLIRITHLDSDVDVFDRGGVDGTPQTVFDLVPPTDIEYEVRNGHRLILDLRDSTGTQIEDSAEIFFIGQDATEEDTTKMGRSYRYGEFAQANQRDEDEVVTLDLERQYEFSEASHLKMQLDSETAIDWAESQIELEVRRKS